MNCNTTHYRANSSSVPGDPTGNFPVTPGALRTARSGSIITGLQEAFFTKISSDFATFEYSSYMGEAGDDIARGVVVDAGGAAIVVGATDAASFPTTNNAFDRTLNSTEAFLFRGLQRRPIVTLTTVPIGRALVLNGTTVTGPYQAPCDEPALLPLTVSSPQMLGGTRFVFQDWWDGGTQNRTLDCTADISLGVNFTAEVLLSVGSTPAGLHLRVDGVEIATPWSAWVPRGSNHTVEAMNPLEEGTTRYLFLGWADGGPSLRTLALAAPVSLVAQYTADAYSFDLLSEPPGLAATVDGVNFTTPAHLWLTIGSNHTFGAPSPQPWSAGVRYAFESWSDGGAASHALRIDAPGSLTARFAAEFAVVLDSDPSGLSVLIDGLDTVLPWAGWRPNGTGMSLAPPPSAPIVGRTMYGAMAWSDGGASSRTWTVWRSETLTALFQPVAYELLIESSPSGVPLTLEGTTENASQSYQQAGATVSVGAPQNVTIGDTRYLFLRWSDTGDPTHFATVTGPLTLTAYFSRVFEVRVNATPGDARFRIDGVEFTGDAELWMAEGSVHQLSASETLGVGVGRRLAWVSWGDGEAVQHAYTAAAPRWLNLTYRAEVFLTVVSPGGDPACDVPNCWYPLGATATVSVKSPWNESGGRREVLRGWLGNDSASGSAATIVMNAPDDLTVLWADQFQLSVASRFSTTSGSGWYDEGAGAAFSVAASEISVGGVRYRFTGWSGDVLSTSAEGLVFMDGPKSVVAVWEEVRVPPTEAPLWLIVPIMVGAAGVAAFFLVRRKRAQRTLERAWKHSEEWAKVDDKGQR